MNRRHLLVLAAALGACVHSPAPWSDEWLAREGKRFREDTAYRRAALEHSLTNHDNLYSQERLTAYALGDRGWDLLPEWNPRSRPIDGARAAKLAAGEPPSLPADQPPLWDGVEPKTREEWIALGRRVFTEYPMRADVFMEYALTKPDYAKEIGLERTADGGFAGLIEFKNVDGHVRAGITCAVCHASVKDGALRIGTARRHFDYGRLRVQYFADTGEPVDPELIRRMKTWGPGRADVTEDNDEDPVAIPDLW
ncbi:MAG TPA: hypothetical protein VLV15_07680, partial [Dongiaceae bacterium]|nr:hypothetical protein [Dongiaceae bacterium]